MTSLIHRWEVTESEQYPGTFELTGEDGRLIRYYMVAMPCGRICLRKSSEQVWESAEPIASAAPSPTKMQDLNEECATLRKDCIRLNVERDALKAVVEDIAYGKQHSGVIPCPQDYGFYIKPWEDAAKAVLSDIVSEVASKPR